MLNTERGTSLFVNTIKSTSLKTKIQATPSLWRPRLVVYTLTKFSGVFQYIYQLSNLIFLRPDLIPWGIVVWGFVRSRVNVNLSQGPLHELKANIREESVQKQSGFEPPPLITEA